MPNPFKRYPKKMREQAIKEGIVADVARELGVYKSTISRILSGQTVQPKPEHLKALNAWLQRAGYRVADANGVETARQQIEQIRRAQQC